MWNLDSDGSFYSKDCFYKFQILCVSVPLEIIISYGKLKIIYVNPRFVKTSSLRERSF